MSSDIVGAIITALGSVSATVQRGLSITQSGSRPAVYVSRVSEAASPSSADNWVVQQVGVTVQMLIASDASAIDGLRDDIMAAVIGLVPGSDCDAIEFAGGNAIDSGASAIWWRDNYTVNQYRRQSA